MRCFTLLLMICVMRCLPAHAVTRYVDGYEVVYSGDFAYIVQDGLATIVGHMYSELGWEYWYDDRDDVWSSPDEEQTDEDIGEGNSDGEGDDYGYTMVIPDRLDGYPVVAIGVGAFIEMGITDVTISEGITSIGSGAFAYCYYIDALTIPESVVYIAEDAFEGWFGGTTLRVIEGTYAAQYAEKNELPYTYDMEYKVFNSGEWRYTLVDGTATICGYFGEEDDAIDLMIPGFLDEYPITAIGYGSWLWSFSRAGNLVSVTIPDSITSIDDRVFADCGLLTRIDVSPSNPVYKDIEGVLFDKQRKTLVYYPSAREGAFTIPGGVTGISEGAFYESTGLTSVIIPDGVTSIGDSVFCGCEGLTSVIIPASVTSIGENAFTGCKNLSSVTIPDSVTSIGDYAFSRCWALTGVTIPAIVTEIGINPFADCRSLARIDVSPDNPMYEDIDGILFDKQRQTLMSFPGARKGDYTILDGVTSIGRGAYYGCMGLTGVIIPDSVTSLGDRAFAECESLTSVVIPDSVTNIGYAAFAGCSRLASVTIPASVTEIGYFVFRSCNKLTLSVKEGSYAEQYAKENNHPYVYAIE
jgi:hypothetical protein